MKRHQLSGKHHAEPSELDRLLIRLGRQRFRFLEFDTDHHGPFVVAAIHEWGEVADVLILFDEDHACAFRTPSVDSEGNKLDVLDPEILHSFYSAGPVHTIRHLLEMKQPAHPDAVDDRIPAPQMARIPREQRRLLSRERMRRRDR